MVHDEIYYIPEIIFKIYSHGVCAEVILFVLLCNENQMSALQTLS